MTKKEQIDEAQAAAAARDTAEKNAEKANAAYIVARDACNEAAEKDAAAYRASQEANKVWFAYLRNCKK